MRIAPVPGSVESRTQCPAVPGHGTPAARGSKEEEDATCNRRPARYDPKDLLFNMTERSKPDMHWSERYGYDQHPEEYSRKNKGYSKIFLTNTF
jgi:hypothetical protein